MKLTLDQIKSVTFGAIKIAEEERGLRFYRCTDKQIEDHEFKKNENYTHSSSGVRLDFHTNARKISFDADFADIWGSYVYEIMVDDLMVGHYNLKELHEKGEVPMLELPEGEKRITLLFPILGMQTWIKYVELDDGATLIPHKYGNKKLYFIGDSITQGYSAHYNFVALPHAISRRFNTDFVSSGVGGWHFSTKAVDKIPYDPDYVLIILGTNNWNGSKYSNTTAEQFDELLKKFAARYKECFPNKKTIVISPIWRGDGHEDRPIGKFDDTMEQIKSFALNNGFMYIDGLKLVPPYIEFVPDKIHPNDIGFMVYAERLCAELEKIIELN